MVYPGRTFIAGRQKALVTIVVATLLCLPIVNTKLAEAILSFCFGGIVPGTDIILSPDTVIWSVAALLSLGGLIFAWFYGRRARRTQMHYRRLDDGAVAIPVAVVSAAPIAELSVETPIATVVSSAKPRTHRMRAFRISLGRTLGDALMTVAVFLANAAQLVWAIIRLLAVMASAGLRVVTSKIKAGMLATFRGLSVALRFVVTFTRSVTRTITRTIWRFSVRAAIATWRWAKPRLLKMDAWLELQVRKVESRTTRQINRSEGLSAARVILREYLKSDKPK